MHVGTDREEQFSFFFFSMTGRDSINTNTIYIYMDGGFVLRTPSASILYKVVACFSVDSRA